MAKVNEIFLSIQGEGINAGEPTVFIRLAGCNLYPDNMCNWCDTKYAQANTGDEYTIDEIINMIVELSPNPQIHICITGGEPLFKVDELANLTARLSFYNYYLEVFTNGTCPKPSWWTRVDSWAVDCKMPSTGVKLPFDKSWYELRSRDQFKITVANEEDLIAASDAIAKMAFTVAHVIVSPVIPLDFNANTAGDGVCIDCTWLRRVAEFCIEKKVRYSLQLQKIIWGNRKGV